jgi:hypothetical protein
MACAPVASVFAGVLRETAGAWQAYECPVGYAIDRLDVTITEATAGATLAVGEADQVQPVWALPAGATLPASGVRFVLERMGGLNYRSVGIGGGGAAMVASIAVELVRVCR